MTGDVASLVFNVVQSLGVVLSLALLDALALPERPSNTRIRLPDILTSLTATGSGGVWTFGSRGAEAVSAVGGVEVGCSVFMEVEGGGRNG